MLGIQLQTDKNTCSHGTDTSEEGKTDPGKHYVRWRQVPWRELKQVEGIEG